MPYIGAKNIGIGPVHILTTANVYPTMSVIHSILKYAVSLPTMYKRRNGTYDIHATNDEEYLKLLATVNSVPVRNKKGVEILSFIFLFERVLFVNMMLNF
jgi:hypothetical protein